MLRYITACQIVPSGIVYVVICHSMILIILIMAEMTVNLHGWPPEMRATHMVRKESQAIKEKIFHNLFK